MARQKAKSWGLPAPVAAFAGLIPFVPDGAAARPRDAPAKAAAITISPAGTKSRRTSGCMAPSLPWARKHPRRADEALWHRDERGAGRARRWPDADEPPILRRAARRARADVQLGEAARQDGKKRRVRRRGDVRQLVRVRHDVVELLL